jgi:hypothetical protein
MYEAPLSETNDQYFTIRLKDQDLESNGNLGGCAATLDDDDVVLVVEVTNWGMPGAAEYPSDFALYERKPGQADRLLTIDPLNHTVELLLEQGQNCPLPFIDPATNIVAYTRGSVDNTGSGAPAFEVLEFEIVDAYLRNTPANKLNIGWNHKARILIEDNGL